MTCSLTKLILTAHFAALSSRSLSTPRDWIINLLLSHDLAKKEIPDLPAFSIFDRNAVQQNCGR
jgi:hypothetical protein